MKYLEEALALLKLGNVIATKTDTVYGLLAGATIDTAVQQVYELKKRPKNKALIVLVNNLEMANNIAEFTDETMQYAHQVWLDDKKPVTLVLKAKNISRIVTGGGDTLALRLPHDEFCLELIHQLGHPVVAPSANIAGHPTAISADMVKNDFDIKLPLIIDRGTCTNTPSTIISLLDNKLVILRQ
ncbi:MAG: threonylcarbamoyl-AMP synthase [Alphaproteobacteria bacterium]|nr:threonylcarbamoyl-AMP synthase [Alphaproteobacteria bacterium]